jgi:hypothetical protein
MDSDEISGIREGNVLDITYIIELIIVNAIINQK